MKHPTRTAVALVVTATLALGLTACSGDILSSDTSGSGSSGSGSGSSSSGSSSSGNSSNGGSGSTPSGNSDSGDSPRGLADYTFDNVAPTVEPGVGVSVELPSSLLDRGPTIYGGQPYADTKLVDRLTFSGSAAESIDDGCTLTVDIDWAVGGLDRVTSLVGQNKGFNIDLYSTEKAAVAGAVGVWSPTPDAIVSDDLTSLRLPVACGGSEDFSFSALGIRSGVASSQKNDNGQRDFADLPAFITFADVTVSVAGDGSIFVDGMVRDYKLSGGAWVTG